MKPSRTPLALCLLLAFSAAPSFAQSNEELLKELKALRARVDELEKKLQAVPAPPADGTQAQWGMTPEQAAEFNKLLVKTEGIEDATETNGFKDLKFSGFMDPVYIWNKDQKRAGFQFLNPVPEGGYSYDNGYFGTLSIDLQKELEGGTKVHINLMPSRGAGSIAGANWSIVHEASVSIPTTDLQTRVLAGQIPDWSGYEYTQPTQTKLVTRGLLLDYTEPTAYTGAGMEIIRGKWDVKAVLANFNKTQQAPMRLSPVLAYRADYSKGEFSGFGFAGVEGRVSNFNAYEGSWYTGAQDTWLDLIEFDGYFIRGDLTLQGQVGYGRQRDAAIVPAADEVTARDAQWAGLSGLVAYKLDPRLEAAARLDFIKNDWNGGGLLGYTGYYGGGAIGNPDGSGNGDYISGIGPSAGCVASDPTTRCTGANRAALAMGFNYLLTQNATLKAEYRYDWASEAVFYDYNSGSYRRNNHLLGASVVVNF
jgi:hypothetical protein